MTTLLGELLPSKLDRILFKEDHMGEIPKNANITINPNPNIQERIPYTDSPLVIYENVRRTMSVANMITMIGIIPPKLHETHPVFSAAIVAYSTIDILARTFTDIGISERILYRTFLE